MRAAWVLVAASALAVAAEAEEPRLRASMDCRSEPGSGRLLCTVALAASPGLALGWSDALVVSSPPSVQPLRARVTSASAEPQRIVVGFVLGSGPGGPIEVMARAVTCPVAGRAGACRPSSARVAFQWDPPAA